MSRTRRINPKWRKYFIKFGNDWKKYTADRLKLGRGVFGRLAPKKYAGQQGFRLGYEDTPGGIPQRIAFAPISLNGTRGWTITVARLLKDFIFDQGRSGSQSPKREGVRFFHKRKKGGGQSYQPQRQYAGFTAEWSAKNVAEFAQAIVDEIRKSGLFK